MTHHEFGRVQELAKNNTRAQFSLTDCVLLDTYATVAVQTVEEGRELPVIALEVQGRINKSRDTFRAVLVLPLMSAGNLAGALWNATNRIGTEEAASDFKVGFDEEAVKGNGQTNP